MPPKDKNQKPETPKAQKNQAAEGSKGNQIIQSQAEPKVSEPKSKSDGKGTGKVERPASSQASPEKAQSKTNKAQTAKLAQQKTEKSRSNTPAKTNSQASSAKPKSANKIASEKEQKAVQNKIQPVEESEDLEATSELVTSAQETDQAQEKRPSSASKTAKDLTKKLTTQTKNLKNQSKEIFGKITGKKKAGETDKSAENEELDKTLDMAATMPGRKSKKRQGRQLIQKTEGESGNKAPSAASKFTEELKIKMKRQLEADNIEFNDEIRKRLKEEKDVNGMNAFHRAATDHNLLLVEEMLEIDRQLVEDKRLWINSESKYGETPLLISSMLKQTGEVDGKNVRRDHFIDFLLEGGALVNTTNKHTLWSPAHWAARHGDSILLDKLLEKNATPFTPDAKGFFPIDYAGKFEHWGIVKKLVDVSIDFFKKLQEKEKNPALDPFHLNDPDIKDLRQKLFERGLAPERQDAVYDKADVFLLSPIYATSLLYWGSMVEEVTIDQMRTILFEMESYPEAVTALPSQLRRSPCHAVAVGGSVEKMELIYDEFIERHRNFQETMANISFKLDMKSAHAPFKKEPKVKKRLNFEIPLEFRKLKQMKDFYIKSFWPQMFNVHRFKQAPISTMQDRNKSTPLHLAALNDNEEAVVKLLTKYQCAIDVRNAEGVMAKDIGEWHEKIGAVFKDFYAEFDKTMGGPVGVDKDQWYSKEISDSFREHRDKNDLRDTKLLRRLVDVASTSNKKQLDIISNTLRARSQVPIQPQVVLKVVAKGQSFFQRNLGKFFGAGHEKGVQRKRLNDFIKQMDATEFQIGMFKGVDEDTFLILVDLPDDEIAREAQVSNYPVKLHGLSAKVPFENSLKKRVEPFKSKDIQFLIIQKLERMFDLHKLRMNGILQAVVPMHDDQSLWYISEKYKKPARWLPHSFSTSKAFFMEDFEDTRFSDVNAYMHYFGENKGIINTFFEFCTIYMAVPAILSAIVVANKRWVSQGESLLIVFYAILKAIWTTYMIERQK